jgi:hypothetical protein
MAKANAAKPINLIISFLPCLRLLAQVLHASTLRQIKSSIRLLRSALNLSHNATSDEGQTRKYSPQHMFSAVPLTTDIQRLLRHVRKVPKAVMRGSSRSFEQKTEASTVFQTQYLRTRPTSARQRTLHGGIDCLPGHSLEYFDKRLTDRAGWIGDA